MKKREEFNKQWAKVVAKCWSDSAFKERLLKEPERVLKEEGLPLPEGKVICLHQPSEKEIHLMLPEQTEGFDEQQLKAIAAGNCDASYLG